MKTNKQILIACEIIAFISITNMFLLHNEMDIRLQEVITKVRWIYDYDERTFYQGIWSSIFTGAIISLITTFVTYRKMKHDVEFGLQSSEEMLLIYFSSLATPMYVVNLGHLPSNDKRRHRVFIHFRNQRIGWNTFIYLLNGIPVMNNGSFPQIASFAV